MTSFTSTQEDVKKEIELSAKSKFRGYQPLGSNVTRYENGFSRDWHEGIDLYREGQVSPYTGRLWLNCQSDKREALLARNNKASLCHLIPQFMESSLPLVDWKLRGK